MIFLRFTTNTIIINTGGTTLELVEHFPIDFDSSNMKQNFSYLKETMLILKFSL